ncbi:MAG: xanthine phosphoribosyltransferase [Succinivibrio sp.]|nr:xanthine phosphoribosyltransferase [Succinivibrio sp.]
MNFLEKKILADGIVKEGNVLKVDSFLNHQLDVELFNEMGREWARLFKDVPVNKILTIEASGIAIACIAALYFKVPVVFAKKAKTLNIDGDVFVSEVESFTHKTTNKVIVSKKYLNPGDNVLLIDDFLANGSAMNGLTKIVEMAGAKVAGIGIAIEKGYQNGGKLLREKGYRLESLAIIEAMDVATGTITFRDRN